MKWSYLMQIPNEKTLHLSRDTVYCTSYEYNKEVSISVQSNEKLYGKDRSSLIFAIFYLDKLARISQY